MDCAGTNLEIISWENLDEGVRQAWEERLDGVQPPPLLLDSGSQRLSLQDFNPRDLATLVSKDAILASKILAVANSAQFGLSAPLTSVQRAIVHMGFNLVKTIMMAYQVESSFSQLPNVSAEHLDFVRRWSAGSSIFALHWANAVDHSDPSTISTLALLSRLGTIVLGNVDGFSDEEYKQIPTAAARLRHEQDNWHISTPALSSYLAAMWGLPEILPDRLGRVWEPLFNEMPTNQEGRVLVLVCACDALMQHYIVDPDCDPSEILSHPDYVCLKENLGKHGLISALGKLWAGLRLQRDLAGATGG